MAKDVDAQWPRWPSGTAGNVVLDVVVDKGPDEVFLMAYGGDSEFRRKCNEALGNREFSCTPWLDSLEGADPQAASDAAAALPDPAALKSGMVKKQTYYSSSMGVKFRNEELVRLVEAQAGQAYCLEVCVATTATYGDKFRPVLRHEVRGVDGGRAALRVTATLVFVKSVNGLLKGMMEKGARDGMARNFAAFRKALEGFARVADAAAAGLPAAAAVGPKPALIEVAPAAEGAGVAELPQPSVLETVAGAPLARNLQPWAAYMHARAAQYPVLGGLGEEGVLVALAALCLLCALYAVVDVLRFLQHASRDPQDTVALITHYALKIVDVPDNIQEALSACVLIYLVRVVVNKLATRLPRPPPAPASAAGSPGAVAALAEPAAAGAAAAGAGPAAAGEEPSPVKGQALGGAALGAVAVAGAATGVSSASSATPDSLTMSPRSDAEEQQGVQYEGYAQVMADVDKQVREDESNLTSPPPEPSNWSAGGIQRLNEQSTKAMRMLKGNFKEFKKSMKALTGSATKSAPNLKDVSGSPEKQGGAAGVRRAQGGVEHVASEPMFVLESSEDEEYEGRSTPGASCASPLPSASQPPSLNGGVSPTRAAALSPPRARPASPSPAPAIATGAAATAAAAAAATGAAAASGPAASGPAAPSAAADGAVGVAQEVPQEVRAAAAAAAGGPPAAEAALPGESSAGGTPGVSRRTSAASEAAPGSGSSFFSRNLLRRASAPGEKTPASAKKRGSGDGVTSPKNALSPRASISSDWEAGLSTGRLQRASAVLMPPGVPPELQPHAITAEVFENQRLQPFRGWGHTWPGHFLPTDKVHHWSLRELPGQPVVAGEDLEEVVIQPPVGWRWVESEWRVDASGREHEAVDEEGWAYGLDFWAVRDCPFQPHQGKKKVTDFVRRRRWVRTQIPVSLESLAALQTPSTTTESPTANANGVGASSAASDSGEGGTAAGSLRREQGGAEAGAGAGEHHHARRALEVALASVGAEGEEDQGVGPHLAPSELGLLGVHVPPAEDAAAAAVAAADAAAAAAAGAGAGSRQPARPRVPPSAEMGPLAAAVAAARGFDAGHLSHSPPPSSQAHPIARAGQPHRAAATAAAVKESPAPAPVPAAAAVVGPSLEEASPGAGVVSASPLAVVPPTAAAAPAAGSMDQGTDADAEGRSFGGSGGFGSALSESLSSGAEGSAATSPARPDGPGGSNPGGVHTAAEAGPPAAASTSGVPAGGGVAAPASPLEACTGAAAAPTPAREAACARAKSQGGEHHETQPAGVEAEQGQGEGGDEGEGGGELAQREEALLSEISTSSAAEVPHAGGEMEAGASGWEGEDLDLTNL